MSDMVMSGNIFYIALADLFLTVIPAREVDKSKSRGFRRGAGSKYARRKTSLVRPLYRTLRYLLSLEIQMQVFWAGGFISGFTASLLKLLTTIVVRKRTARLLL
jgi:hypothetical protein